MLKCQDCPQFRHSNRRFGLCGVLTEVFIKDLTDVGSAELFIACVVRSECLKVVRQNIFPFTFVNQTRRRHAVGVDQEKRQQQNRESLLSAAQVAENGRGMWFHNGLLEEKQRYGFFSKCLWGFDEIIFNNESA